MSSEAFDPARLAMGDLVLVTGWLEDDRHQRVTHVTSRTGQWIETAIGIAFELEPGQPPRGSGRHHSLKLSRPTAIQVARYRLERRIKSMSDDHLMRLYAAMERIDEDP